MSYILDALRRADAERERGGVPGLNAQSVDLVADEGPVLRRGVPAWGWAVLGGAVVAALVAFWMLWVREEPAPSPQVRAEAPPLPITPAPVPVTPPPAVAMPAAPPPVTAAPQAPPPSMAPPPEASPRRAPPPKPARRTAQAQTRAAPAPAASVAELRATPWAEMPEEFRRSVPTMTFGGSTYSPNPASRMLIVNGLVQREGDEPAPGVTIKQIRLRSAVFEYRGQRYEIAF